MKRILLALFVTTSCLVTGTINNVPKVIAQEIPKAQCLSDYGKILCGYNCISDYGQIGCADWPGGVCEASYGKIVCGPSAPANWLDAYTNKRRDRTSEKSKDGVYGAWAVDLGSNRNGLLRMNGSIGTLVLVSGQRIAEQKMTFKREPNGKYALVNGAYVLVGQVSATYNYNKYNPETIYIKEFSKNISTVMCEVDVNRCTRVNLTYLGE